MTLDIMVFLMVVTIILVTMDLMVVTVFLMDMGMEVI